MSKTRRRTRPGDLRIGTSGYHYDHWKKVFYPAGVPKRDWLLHYARYFNAVEINGTFYRLPEASTFEAWRERAPAGFIYALKYSRYATHLKRLKDPEGPIELFLERATRLRKQLGPILVQLPPRWNVDSARLEAFLEAAPGKHRWALEFRDRTWLCEETYEQLERHDAALCIHDGLERHPYRVTTSWVYLRYHGTPGAGLYSPQYLTAQAKKIRAYLEDGKDVYAFFNNDAEGYAVRNAIDLERYIRFGSTGRGAPSRRSRD